MPKTRPIQRNPLTRLSAPTSASPEPENIRIPDSAQTAPQPERIELLPPSRLSPDPYQPRHPLLPPEVRTRFQEGAIDAYQAAREWLRLAEEAPWSLGREVEDLLAMGAAFDREGQVNPITAYPLGTGEPQSWRIETGERRFWAAVLKAVKEHPSGAPVDPEPLLRVVIVPGPSRARQLLENLHLEPPTAVGQARGAAGLILERAGIRPPETAEEEPYAYFRQALDVRLTEDLVAYLVPILKIKQRRIYQLLELLQLPSEALDLADRARLPYLTLAAVQSEHLPEDWLKEVARSAQAALEKAGEQDSEELGSGEPEANPQKPPTKTHVDPGMLAARGIRRFYNAAYRSWRTRGNALDTVANEIYAQGHAADTVRMLRELAALIEVRVKGKEG